MAARSFRLTQMPTSKDVLRSNSSRLWPVKRKKLSFTKV